MGRKFSKKVLAGIMSMALATSMIPAGTLIQKAPVVKAAATPLEYVNVGDEDCLVYTYADLKFDKDGNFSGDYEEDAVLATGGSIVAYVNGSKTGKTCSVYTDATAGTSYTKDSKGKIKATAGKLIVGVVAEATVKANKDDAAKFMETVVSKNKIVDEAGAKIAKASIKNGMITVTAAKSAGEGYVVLADTSKLKNKPIELIPISIKAAPSNVDLVTGTSGVVNASGEIDATKLKAAKLSKLPVNVATDAAITILPSYKNADKKQVVCTTELTYKAEIKDGDKQYFTALPKVEENTLKFEIKKDLSLTKVVNVKVNVICNESGKKAGITLAIGNSVTGITNLEAATGATAKKNTEDPKIAYDIDVTATGSAIAVTPTLEKPGTGDTTDKVTVYAMSGKDSYTIDAKGKVKVTGKASGEQTKVTMKYNKSTKKFDLTVKKGYKTNTSTYFLIVYNTDTTGGYCVAKVTPTK